MKRNILSEVFGLAAGAVALATEAYRFVMLPELTGPQALRALAIPIGLAAILALVCIAIHAYEPQPNDNPRK